MKTLAACLVGLHVAVAGCVTNQPQEKLVGTWSEAGTATLITFQADGVVKIVTGTQTTQGTYSFEPPQALTLRFDGAAQRPGPHHPVCTLNGDRMQLRWDDKETFQYSRLR